MNTKPTQSQYRFCGKEKSHTKLSSSVHTRLAQSFTGFSASPGPARFTSNPSHQHFRYDMEDVE